MHKPRLIDVFVFEGVNLLDISGPVQAFHSTPCDGDIPYRHRFISRDGNNIKTSCGMEIVAQGSISNVDDSADLLIPGGEGIDACLEDKELLNALRKLSARPDKKRLISICSGALLLAAVGLLDGKVATTHWGRAEMAKVRFPKVLWQLDRIYTKSGQIYTSAGVSTGIDLALAIIEEDFGTSNSLKVA